ncbi:YitT family protein [Alphaproteobacteria bacterium GH1-50]|uniref:YitT family protein n=1 Tax=Kangsaoukella pontilimi TaxID=2691042 RepID=A0A7C9IRJ5_9RHOB|nr:YitT family protein [Kangsaoukella pontilimi]MXQ08823.1 YitT family protein [Kangsaoukella pontilimi]
MLLLEKPPADRHSFLEDVQGILVGTTLVALSIQFLRASDLITGQIAGLALVTTYASDWSFGLVFFLMNVPFFLLGLTRMGWRFVAKTTVAVALMSVIADTLPLVLTINDMPPALGAVLAGILAGVGLISLFRHGATLGGVGIVALILQDTKDIPAGYTQLAFDLVVFTLAVFLFPWPVVVWSLLGAVVLNTIIATNHRRDRYIAR